MLYPLSYEGGHAESSGRPTRSHRDGLRLAQLDP